MGTVLRKEVNLLVRVSNFDLDSVDVASIFLAFALTVYMLERLDQK